MKRALSAVLAAVLLAGCGSDGDGEDTGTETAPRDAGTPTPSADTAVFEAKNVGFKFEYPEELVRGKDAGVLGQVSLAEGDSFNAIKVRQAADRELPPGRYLADFQRDFERRVGDVERRTETIGAVEAGVLEFGDTVERAGEQVEFRSTSYFFAGAGRTWQVECVAEPENADEIESACEAALESLEFDRS